MRTRVSGESRRTRSMNETTAVAGCRVAAGLLGLSKKIRPAPRAASAIASRSWWRVLVPGTALTGAPIIFATSLHSSYDGVPPTSGFEGEVKANVAVLRICVEPQPIRTFSGLHPYLAAMASDRSGTNDE